MSGGQVPYHLRPNKAVEREIFFDLLSHLQARWPIRNYRYIAMGGPYMEDFRIAFRSLGITRFTSIESNAAVCERQKFNAPIAGIDFCRCKTRQFIDEYEPAGPAIFWLDYTDGERKRQLLELATLVGKALRGDIIKITFNAEPRSVAKRPADANWDISELAEKLCLQVKQDFGVEPEEMNRLMAGVGEDSEIDVNLGVAKMLSLQAKRICGEAMKARTHENVTLMPLTALRYRDGMHQMLTLTAVLVGDSETAAGRLEQSADQVTDALAEVLPPEWALRSPDWAEVHLIDVPDLSVREKLTMDSVRFDADPQEVIDKLGHSLGVDVEDAKTSIGKYRQFARYYPLFGRMYT